MDSDKNWYQRPARFRWRTDMVHGGTGCTAGNRNRCHRPSRHRVDTTITGEFCTPSMSCIIQRETKAVNAACFDLNAACSGFVYAMDTAHRFLMTDPHMKYALVVANESLSKITNYSDRSSCILFGDGAAAAIIEYAPDALYTSHLGADGTGAKYLYAHSALPRSPFVKAKREVECGDPDMQLAPQWPRLLSAISA